MPEVADCFYCSAIVPDDKTMITLRVPCEATTIKPEGQPGFAHIKFAIVRAHKLCHGLVAVVDRIPEENLQNAL